MAGSSGTQKNKLNKIREEAMERDNTEVHAHHRVDFAALLLDTSEEPGGKLVRASQGSNEYSVDWYENGII